MNEFLKHIFVLAAAFGLVAGGICSPVHAVENAPKEAKIHRVDVNTATLQELEDLSGIGETYAKKIIDGRPYKTADDLVKAGIPQRTVDKIKDSIRFGKIRAVEAPKSKATTPVAKPARSTTEDNTARVPPHKGMVWVNTETKVYHKEGDHWYGNTVKGEFMTEENAIKSGARAAKHD
jgi:hypothetical protein